jgi:TonB family protein
LQPLATELMAAIGADATLAITDDIHTPATVGARRAVILLPRRILDLPAAVQRAVIAHELVHVRRRDWLHTIAEEFWCAALWFHPAARVIATRLSLARETIVDEATIGLTRDRRAYAEALLAFSDPRPHVVGLTPLIGRRSLSQRISLITEEDVMSRARVLTSLALAILFATTATSAAVVMFPMTAAAQEYTYVHKPGNGVSLPVPTREAKAEYPPAAMQRGIQGSVFLRVVVLASGEVGDVQVSQSLDAEYGLDDAAVAAMKKWQFEPGKKGGKPVAVEVAIEMSFRLK